MLTYAFKPFILYIYSRYFKSQWAMPISKNFEFYDLFNYQIMKIKESGILNFIKQSYEDKYGGIHRKCEFSAPEKTTPSYPQWRYFYLDYAPVFSV